MFKNVKLLLQYIRILKRNREMLKIDHDISIDWVYRMYKTYRIPDDETDNIKLYGVQYVNDLLKKEIARIDGIFNSIGLRELCGLMEAVELNDKQIGLAFRFKYLNTAKMFKRFFWSLFYMTFGVLGFLIGSFLGLGIGLFSILVIYLITRLFV